MKFNYNLKYAMEQLHIKTLRKHQIKPIDSILNRQDTLVISPTGSGKSAIFQCTALVMHKKTRAWTLVIEPTISLMLDQVETLNSLGIGAEWISGTHPMKTTSITYLTDEGKERRIQIDAPFLYVTPERLASPSFRKAVAHNPPGMVVIDEAHCILEWGYTFRSSYLKISDFIAQLKHRPVVAAFTATAPESYREEICRLLKLREPKIFSNSLVRPNLILLHENCSKFSIKQRLSKVKYCAKKYGQDGRVVIYCATRKYVDMVANYLTGQFPGEVVKCHAYMDSGKQEKNEVAFIRGKKRIMVATTAFGMGVDVSDIRLVIHFNLPLSVIDYYQQIGRAGRDGNKAHAVLLYHPDDIDLAKHIVSKENLTDDVKKWLARRIQEMADLAESSSCIMQQMLSALGEKHPKTCRHCTNCQRMRRGYDAPAED
ncbi:ATP-dependent DNA helicase RecQ [Pseudoflavonifractor sp. AF19-9AC]|uniref:RecQ family ATP-dependent DNA helicase n=1 Tax=Pseudoflavonifractor sp. AF19-9AC TaxID=2292244 RepID=UPI000E515D34|nr:RecQ family ATP-dependent DNA helicase [Pseudoflavonifractor sp. AF19-9AC]RHR11029.1 ATP-dependent DNA helicase RecQ [Pseudoflavonifractor sp. AF19-9AC]